MYKIDILIDLVHFDVCTYMSHENVFVGEVVQVDFRGKKKMGLVIANPGNEKIVKGLKYITDRTFIKFDERIVRIIRCIAQYYCISQAKVLSLFLNKYLVYKNLKLHYKMLQEIQQKTLKVEINLNSNQLRVVNNLSIKKPNLIFGVTGSGKTEVYFKIAQKYILVQKQVLILLPEINLARNIAQRFKDKFGYEALLWHSKSLQKTKAINSIINNYSVIIGTRSSLFLPYQNLACVIVDEEHDLSYKQDTQVLYNARDLAVLISSILAIQVCLFTATPTLESYYNAQIGKYNLLYLNQQYSSIKLPTIQYIQHNSKEQILHKKILEQMHKVLERGEQVMIYLNRKGYHRLVFCKNCSSEVKCRNCSIPLVWYQSKQKLYCHYCSGEFKLKCLECEACTVDEDLKFYGLGIEQLYEYILELFSESYKVKYITSDMNNIVETINDFSKGKIDIIITTQVMAKGYHCSNLTFVVMLNMDLQSCPTNFRANEHSMQMINQVRGRCGREKAGEVVLQSYKKHKNINGGGNSEVSIKTNQNNQNNHPIQTSNISQVKNVDMMTNQQDYEKFLKYELSIRKEYALPPIRKMVGVIIYGSNERLVHFEGREVLKFYMERYDDVMGPVESLVYKVNNIYRLRVFITMAKNIVFAGGYQLRYKENTVKYDVDIYNFF